MADDIVRCHLLRGLARRQIVRRLGAPDEHDKHFLSYFVGAERDSFVQVDSESLDIELRRDGTFRRAELAQG